MRDDQTINEAADQALVWEKPELRKLDAGSAEGAINVGADIGIYS